MTEIVPTPPRRAEELCDLTAKCFGRNYFDFLDRYVSNYYAGSAYDWGASRVAIADGRIVGHVGVFRYAMRVGSARLTTGGVGAVMTHGRYRNRGIAARVVRATVEAMRAAGYHYTILFGIPGFYHRFGYVQAWPATEHVAEVEALPDEPLKLALRRLAMREPLCGDGAVMRIYNRDNAARTGTAERPIFTRLRQRTWRCHGLCDAAGRVRGYVLTEPTDGELKVMEVGGLAAPCGTGQLLAAVKRLALRGRCGRVRTRAISYDHPFCRALRIGDCQVELTYRRSGSAMGMVLALRAALEAMAGELTARLADSKLRDFRGRLSIRGAGETVCLNIAGGKVRLEGGAVRTPHRILAGDAAARLLIGSDSPAALAVQSGVKFLGQALPLAEALFPAQWPMLYGLDDY